ncbi:unnamed protein product [Ilex paraguariensis]|uniref:Uncharacterized protein n=1 Tax=Ilex paraguariensis TaxID=185542 RepID=A0ABC8TAW8_9AQUA
MSRESLFLFRAILTRRKRNGAQRKEVQLKLGSSDILAKFGKPSYPPKEVLINGDERPIIMSSSGMATLPKHNGLLDRAEEGDSMGGNKGAQGTGNAVRGEGDGARGHATKSKTRRGFGEVRRGFGEA